MSLQSWASNLLLSLGAFSTLKALYSLYHFLTFYFITPSRPLAAYKSPGTPSYALVTGSSAGIGLGIASALLSQGFNVILLSHIEDELSSVVQSLRQQYPDRDVRAVVMNAITAKDEEIQRMIRGFEEEKVKVSVLVNNVGGCPVRAPPLRRLWTYSAQDVDNVINLNARFTAKLTNWMIPLLRQKSTPEDRSLILNVSSGSWIGMSHVVMYAAVKAFVRSFSVGLARDLEDDDTTKHLDSLCLIPGDVWTQGNCAAIAPGSPKADKYGKMVVEHIDGAVRRGWRWMTPYWQHGLQIGVLERLPEGVANMVLRDAMNGKAAAWIEYWAKRE